MILVRYTPSFIRQFKSLPIEIQEETFEKVEFFKDNKNHSMLKVHKLKGRLGGRFSFSVNYRIRIIFQYNSKNEAILLSIGDHDVYKT